MENKPKSKAFIITFIIVIALLLGGYLLLRNSGTSSTKSGTSLSKIFAPLLGTSKEKNLTTVDKNGTGNGTGTTVIDPNANNNGDGSNGEGDGTGLNNGSGMLNGGELGNGSLGSDALSLSNLNPLPSPKSNATTKPIKNSTTLTATDIKNGLESTTNSNIKESLCPVDDPLSNYFTLQDKEDLDNYLRQFYLIAPTIKTSDDIEIAKNEILENTSFSGQLDSLIKDCNTQKTNPNYTGPQLVKDNPYYQGNSSHETDTYLPKKNPTTTDQTYSLFEKLLNIW